MTLFENKQSLLNLYQSLQNNTDNLFTDADCDFFAEKESYFVQERFNIVIAGRFSSGKSLLINRAFLQADILPSANEPTTCHPVHISYGESNQLYAVDGNGVRTMLANNEEAIKSELINHVALYGENTERYPVLELNWNDEELLKNGVVLVDTIGTEDTEEKYIQQTFREMERAAAVIFTFNIKQAGSKSEQDLIEKYLSKTGKKLFIIINKADLLDLDEQQEVLEDFQERFSSFFNQHDIRSEERIFVVSAKTEVGLVELRKEILTFVANDRFKELLCQHLRLLDERLIEKKRHITLRLKDYREKKEGDDRSIRSAEQKISSFEQDLISREREFEDLQEGIIEETQDKLADDLSDFRSKVKQDLRHADYDELKSEAEDWLERLAKIIDRMAIRLKRDLREGLADRIKGSMSKSDFDELGVRLQSISESISFNTTKMISGTGTFVGVLGIFTGLYQASVIGVGAATVAAQTGLFASAWTAIVGGGVATAPALSALAVATPFVLGGTALASIGWLFYKSFTNKTKEKYRQDFIDTMNKTIRQIKKESLVNIEEYVENHINKFLNNVKKDIDREQEKLKKLISQKDMKAIDRHISEDEGRLQAIEGYQQELKSLDPNKFRAVG